MNITLGKGVDKVLFGMTKAEVIAILGEPDDIRIDEDNEEEVLHYNQLKTLFSFDFEFDDSTDKLLTWIETENPDCKIFETNVIGLNEDQLTDLLEKNEVEDHDMDSDLYTETIISEDESLEVELNFGTVRRVMFGVYFDEDEEIIWPE